METAAAPSKPNNPIAVGPMDRVLAFFSAVILAATIVAIAKGRSGWDEIPVIVWAHLLTIIVALALTPLMLLRRRGDRLHRQLGWIWISSLAATAALSFNIRLINQGGFSPIHILSAWTLIQILLIIWHARGHRPEKHRRAVHGMVIGALVIAGFFTFPFGRLLGNWLFS